MSESHKTPETRSWRAFGLLAAALRGVDRYRQAHSLNDARAADFLKDAKAKVDEALQHDGGYLRARYWSAIVSNLMGDTEEAITLFKDVLKQQPPFSDEVNYNLGVAYNQRSAAPSEKDSSESMRAAITRFEIAKDAPDRALQLFAHGGLAQTYARMEQRGIRPLKDDTASNLAQWHYDRLQQGLKEEVNVRKEDRRELEAVAKITGDMLSSVGTQSRNA